MDGEAGHRRSNRRRRRRSRARVSSSLKVMDLQRSISHRSEPRPLSKTCPPLWSIRPRTEDLQHEVTKKQGRRRKAAARVRSFFTQSSHELSHYERMGPDSQRASVDFTQDQILQESSEISDPPEHPLRGTFPGQRAELSPVVLLSLLHPRLRFSCVHERPHRGAVRACVVLLELEGRVFEGYGRTKGVAKARAAASALHTLSSWSSLRLGPWSSLRVSLGSSPRLGPWKNSPQQLPQLFAESICGLVTKKYRELSLSSAPASLRGLAGIVLTRGMDLSSAQVVAMATGTKYMSVESGADEGLRVRDSHAEVLCRRALLCFFYQQLELLLRSPSDAVAQSIFVPVPAEGAGFCLRDDVHLHMFLSCPPCGDARLHMSHRSTDHKMSSKRWRYGVRMKKTGGEGTLPWSTQSDHKHKASVSCTDKMAKWCVVGLQGALLSHLLEPVYLHSVTIATHSPPAHMHRVMWQRLAPVKQLPFPYRRRPFLLGCVGPCHLLSGGQGAHMSMSWTYGQGSEVVDVRTGLQAWSEVPSRLCPHAMLLRWAQLSSQISGEDADSRTGSEMKRAAVKYQHALHHYRSRLMGAGLMGTRPQGVELQR